MSYESIVRPIDFSDRDLQRLFAESEAQCMRSTAGLADQVVELLDPANDQIHGWLTPWRKFDHEVRIKPGELTVVAGIGGHGKTSLLSMVGMWLLTQGLNVGVMSLEMRLHKLLRLCVGQASGSENPPEEFARDLLGRMEGKFWLYDRNGPTPPLEVFGGIHAFDQLGCRIAIVDSLSLCKVSNDLEREQQFVGEMAGVARALNMHIFLVHHIRKPSDNAGEERVPNKFGVKGSGSLTDLADNVWLVWADKRRAAISDLLEHGRKLSPEDQEYFDKSYDQKLVIAKQRDAKFEGTLGLFKHASRQLVPDRNRRQLLYPLENLA